MTSDAEAQPEESWSDTALAWGPFVEGRARRVVFLRLRHARVMIDSLTAGPKDSHDRLVVYTLDDAQRERLYANLNGR